MLGLDPHRTALDVWAEKTGKRERPGITPAQLVEFDSKYVTARCFERTTGLEVTAQHDLWANDDFPLACAVVDYSVTRASNDSHGILQVRRFPASLRVPGSGLGQDRRSQMEAVIAGVTQIFLAHLTPTGRLEMASAMTIHANFWDTYERITEFMASVLSDTPPKGFRGIGDSNKVRDVTDRPKASISAEEDVEEFARLTELNASLAEEMKTNDRELKNIGHRIRLALGKRDEARCGHFDVRLKPIGGRFNRGKPRTVVQVHRSGLDYP